MNDSSSQMHSVLHPFNVMTKPIGSVCNLKCGYCYYLEKEKLFPSSENYRMSDDVLEAYIRGYIQSQDTPEINFAWQGGEPTLAGLGFYKKAVALQIQYAGGRPVFNAFQTNGTNLDDEWCRFLASEHFLVGLSIDGPEHIHNRYRRDHTGHGSYGEVINALERLKKWKVEFNTLTCVTRESQNEAVEIYRFLKNQDVKFMQFIPVVERGTDPAERNHGLNLAPPPDLTRTDNPNNVMPWAVIPEGFGTFLCDVFDEWIKADVGRIFVNLFDVALGAWCGMEPGLCTYSRRCGNAIAMEHDGGVYSCDHYVYPSCYLGNIKDKTFGQLLGSEQQIRFGDNKRDSLPTYCRECEFLFACNGDCPKHRFMNTPDGEPGLSYLCAGYKMFFHHIDPKMRDMAELLRLGRPAADIMGGQVPAEQRQKTLITGRNEMCPCGSGMKFKKCCGNQVR